MQFKCATAYRHHRGRITTLAPFVYASESMPLPALSKVPPDLSLL